MARVIFLFLGARGTSQSLSGLRTPKACEWAAADIPRLPRVGYSFASLITEEAMPRAIALSRAARTLLSRHLSGERAEETSDELRAYRELAAAGLMTPTDGESSFQLTDEGRARCREFVPHAGELSEASVALLRRRLNGDEEVNDANRAAYRELAMAGVLIPLHTFSGGDESAYRFTEEGWER